MLLLASVSNAGCACSWPDRGRKCRADMEATRQQRRTNSNRFLRCAALLHPRVADADGHGEERSERNCGQLHRGRGATGLRTETARQRRGRSGVRMLLRRRRARVEAAVLLTNAAQSALSALLRSAASRGTVVAPVVTVAVAVAHSSLSRRAQWPRGVARRLAVVWWRRSEKAQRQKEFN